MINRLQLIWITLRRSLLLFFIPIICMYGIIPIVAIVSPRNEGLQNTIMASRILLPPSALLWYMAYLQMWIESEGQEAMRACSKGKHTCAPELMLLAASFMLALLPGAFIVSTVYNPMFHEYFYICVQILWTGGMLYVLSVLLHSVAMSSMLVLSYLLFCAFFSKDSSMQGFCLLKLEALPGWESLTSSSLPLLLFAILLISIGHVGERFFYHRMHIH